MPLHLRMLSLENAPSLFRLIIQNKNYLQEWFEWACHVDNESDVVRFIEQSLEKNTRNRSFDAGLWYDNALVGVIGFHEINWNHKQVELGYWISKEHQGKGIVTESVRAMTAYAFLEYKLNRIEILCDVHNTRSRALAQRLGFMFEGIEREGHQFLGRFFDVACYSFLARDFHITGEENYVQLARQIRSS